MKKNYPYLFIFFCYTIFYGTINAQKNHLVILTGQSNMGNLDPSRSLVPILQDALPNDKFYFVHEARGGRPITKWYNYNTTPAEKGSIYTSMMSKVNEISQGVTYETVTFIFMQGEKDAQVQSTAVIYQQNLEGLVQFVKDDFPIHHAAGKLFFVIGRLNDNRDFPKTSSADDVSLSDNWHTVKDAQETVANNDPNGAWINTNDCNDFLHTNSGKISHDVHGPTSGYRIMGIRFATETLKFIANIDPQINESTYQPRCSYPVDETESNSAPINLKYSSNFYYTGNYNLSAYDDDATQFFPEGCLTYQHPDTLSSDEQDYFQTKDVLIYSNLVKNTIDVRVKEQSNYLLTNLIGKSVLTGVLDEGLNKLNIFSLSQGVYILTVLSPTSKTVVKIVKQ